jgi:concanavalin A-like lectin/glucanase superfamily protein
MTNQTNSYLHFEVSQSRQTYIEIPSSADFSIPTTGELTVCAWLRPATLVFSKTEGQHGSRYIHWFGKGEKNQQEWTFRMYSQDTLDGRENRISFYVFNPEGGEGIGSYFQDSLQVGEWIHIVGVADSQRTYLYRDGVPRDSDTYAGTIVPRVGTAPLRIGTRDLHSFFQGEIREARIWNRRLNDNEIADLYDSSTVPTNGLVAEYLLTQDIATDSAGTHNGIIYAPTWVPGR